MEIGVAHRPVPEIIDPVFVKTSPKRSFSLTEYRVSFETSFDSKQPKLEPKLVSALSETKRLFRLFRFYSIPKKRVWMFRLNRNKQETNRNSLIGSIFCTFYRKCRVFPVFKVFFSFFSDFSVFFVFFVFFGLFRNSLFRLFRFYTKTESFHWTETNKRPTQTV